MSSRDYFAQVAGDWDQLRAGFFSEAVREAALALAGVRTGSHFGQTAADLGAGTGFVTEALLRAGLSVAAVDQSAPMLARLRAKFAATGRVRAFEGQAEALPLADNAVDFVFANMFLHHVDDPARAIGEMARIVRPGGRVVITDLDSHAHAFLLAEHHDRWPGFARSDVAAWMTAAGLERVAVGGIGGNGAGADGEGLEGEGEVCCAESCDGSCDGSASARVSIFAAHARRPLCAIPAAQADPLAVGARARACMDLGRPLLCAESVLLAVSQGLGCSSPLIPRLATGFCSGLSRSCGPCGAFSAGVMALGLALGRDTGLDDLDETYGPVLEFREFFLARFGSLSCPELTGHDLGSPAGLAAYRAQGLKERVCFPILEQAAAQLIRILAEQ